MELRQLHYFVAVADTLSFSRAAESLYVSQSALSKQMASLKEELGGMSPILSLLENIECAPKIRFSANRIAMNLTMESWESSVILPESIARHLQGEDLHILHFNHPSAKLYLIAAWYKGCQNELVHQIAQQLYRKLKEDA